MRVLYGPNLTTKPSDWVEAQPGVRHILPPVGGYIRVVLENGAAVEVRLNDELIHIPKKEAAIAFPCLLGEGGEAVVKVSLPGRSSETYRFQRDPLLRPDPKMLLSLVDFRRKLRLIADSDGDISAEMLVAGIEVGDVPLLVQRDLFAGLKALDFLTKIEDNLSSLLSVCQHPRMHLRVEEEIRPVGMVRRTGPAALRHIASHSEHWEARTVGGLRPARLLAQVLEDDYELYENRLVRTLLDRLTDYVENLRRRLAEARREVENALDWNALAIECTDYRRRRMLDTLIPNFDVERLISQQIIFSEYEGRLNQIARTLTQCVATRFYQRLRRSALVSAPLRATNILLMDPHYHSLYLLWGALEREARNSRADVEVPQESADDAYTTYCAVMALTALRFAGFEPAEGEDARVCHAEESTDEVTFDAKYRRGKWRVSLKTVLDEKHCLDLAMTRFGSTEFEIPASFDDVDLDLSPWSAILEKRGNRLFFSDQPPHEAVMNMAKIELRAREGRPGNRQESQKQSRAWNTFIQSCAAGTPKAETVTVRLRTALTEIGANAQSVEFNSTALLSAVLPTHSGLRRSDVLLHPVSLKALPLEIMPRTLRRLNTIGDNFSPEDASIWGNFRSGALPVSPWQINSLLRLVRLVNTHTIGSEIRLGLPLGHCPVCEEERKFGVGIESEGTSHCHRCDALWGQTRCPSCRHEFEFIRPKVSMSSIRTAKIQNYAAQMEAMENIAGETAICGFCEAPDADPLRIPICPNCGACPRSSNHPQCLRCRVKLASSLA